MKINSVIAELVERSPILYKILVTHLGTTVRPTVQDTTFNMRGQLYRGHTNATALSSSLMVSALSSESDDPGSSTSRSKGLCP